MPSVAILAACEAEDRRYFREHPERRTGLEPERPPDRFPRPIEDRTIAKESHYVCRCGTLSEDPSKCRACGQYAKPADLPTRDAGRVGVLGVIVDGTLPEIGRLLLAAQACACDCRRRRVLLRAARIAVGQLVEQISEEEVGPSATDDQMLTPEEFRAVQQGRDERVYGEYLLRLAKRWEEIEVEYDERHAHDENDRRDRERRERERAEAIAGYAIECPVCGAKPDDCCEGKDLVEYFDLHRERIAAGKRADEAREEAEAAAAHDGEPTPEPQEDE